MIFPAMAEDSFPAQISALEKRHGGKIGMVVKDLNDGSVLRHRAGERFAMCSTFKLYLAAAIAARVDAGKETWDRKISYGKKDLVAHSPITGKSENLDAGGMAVVDLCAAAVEVSDNTAANLLLAALGGPAGMTAFFRSIGDEVSRLDRIEVELNSNTPGDERDTSTPEAVIATMEKILIGDALFEDSRNRMIQWLVNCSTGKKRIRAAFDGAWKAGDKTGTGHHGATNDVAIVWPPGRKPLLIAVYYTGADMEPEKREEVIAEAAKIAKHAEIGR